MAAGGLPALPDGLLYPGAVDVAADALHISITRMARGNAAEVAATFGPGDPHVAADVGRRVADSIVRAWRRGRLLAPTAAALAAVVRRQVWLAMGKERRAAARRRRREEQYGAELGGDTRGWMDPGQAAEHNELREAILRAADTLPPREREAFLLIYQGHTRLEVARAMGVGGETVKEYVKRLYPRMRAQLAAYAGARSDVERSDDD